MKISTCRNIFLLFTAAFSVLSCTKVIDLDLDGHDQKTVIEAEVGTVMGDNSVRITKSKAFNSNEPFTPITDAVVTIKDLTADMVYSLSVENGVFTNPDLQATEEHTYELTVYVDGETFTSKSTVPVNVPLINLTQKGSVEDSQFGFTDLATLTPEYHDPANYENFYHFVIYKNNSPNENFTVRDDVSYNGLDVNAEIYVEAVKNDTITIDFQGIDKPAYQYLFGFSQNVFQTSGTPSNPVSNISSGALGYFKAHTSNIQTIVIQ